MSVNVNLIVRCGFTGCPWSREIDPAAGTDPMTVHQEYLDHLDTHELGDDVEPECETTDSLLDAVHVLVDECPSCHATKDQPHTDYCKAVDAARWAAHDAEVARALAEDKIAGGIYAGHVMHKTPDNPPHVLKSGCCRFNDPSGLYGGDTPEQIAAEQARIDRFMAGGNDQ